MYHSHATTQCSCYTIAITHMPLSDVINVDCGSIGSMWTYLWQLDIVTRSLLHFCVVHSVEFVGSSQNHDRPCNHLKSISAFTVIHVNRQYCGVSGYLVTTPTCISVHTQRYRKHLSRTADFVPGLPAVVSICASDKRLFCQKAPENIIRITGHQSASNGWRKAE